MTRRPGFGDAGLWALVVAAALHALFIAPWLLYPDLTLTYPFLGGDGADWISAGLALAGEPVRDTVRPPLLPAVLAALEKLGILEWFPVLHLVLVHLAAPVAYQALRSQGHPALPSLLAGAILLASATFHRLALHVMADHLAGLLLFAAAACFLAAGRRRSWYLAAGGMAGLAALAQQIALLFPLPAALVVARFRRRHLVSPWFTAGGIAFVALPALWFLWKRLAYGTYGDVVTRYWGTIRPHLPPIDFYAAATAGLLGWPAALLALAGCGVLLRRRPEEGWLIVGLLASIAGFFAFFYDWEAQRFVLYGFLLLAFPLAAALAAMPRRAAIAVGIGALLWAAWPVPPGGAEETRVLLWPLPPVYVEAPQDGGWRITTPTLGEVSAGAVHARVRREWRSRPAASPLPAASLAGIRSVVFLERPETSAEERYRALYRLGNAARRRVKVAPARLYPPEWPGWALAQATGRVAGWALFRVELPAGLGAHLVAMGEADPLARALTDRAASAAGRTAGGGAAARAGEEETREWVIAAPLLREVQRRIGPGDPFLVAFETELAAAEGWRLLPFVVGTSSLFVIGAEDAAEVRGWLAEAPVLETSRLDGWRLVRTRLRGWRAVVLLAGEVGG